MIRAMRRSRKIQSRAFFYLTIRHANRSIVSLLCVLLHKMIPVKEIDAEKEEIDPRQQNVPMSRVYLADTKSERNTVVLQ
jgi:hypothetical protein